MSYRLDVTREARGEIKALPRYVRAQARRLIRALGLDPRPPRARELHDEPNVYRVWLAGRWRIGYSIEDRARMVHVLRVRRKERTKFEGMDDFSFLHEESSSHLEAPPVFRNRASRR